MAQLEAQVAEALSLAAGEPNFSDDLALNYSVKPESAPASNDDQKSKHVVVKAFNHTFKTVQVR